MHISVNIPYPGVLCVKTGHRLTKPRRTATVFKNCELDITGRIFHLGQTEDIYRMNLITCNGTQTKHASQKRDTINRHPTDKCNPIRCGIVQGDELRGTFPPY